MPSVVFGFVGRSLVRGVIVSVTPLGSIDGPAVAAHRIVDYLEGTGQAKRGVRAAFDLAAHVGLPPVGVAGYYPDSTEAPGTWIGSGVGDLRRGGSVDPIELESLLAGSSSEHGRSADWCPRLGGPRKTGPTAGRRGADRGSR